MFEHSFIAAVPQRRRENTTVCKKILTRTVFALKFLVSVPFSAKSFGMLKYIHLLNLSIPKCITQNSLVSLNNLLYLLDLLHNFFVPFFPFLLVMDI